MSLRVVELTDEERWAQAESILVERPTGAAQSRMRRRRTMFWLLVAGLTVLSLGIGVLLVLLVADRGALDAAEPPTWQTVLGLVITGAGLLVDVAGIVVLVRSGRWGQAWRSPATVLSRSQRRDLVAQIRGRRPVDPARLALARDLAQRLADQRGTGVIAVGIVLINLGNTLLRPSVFRLWLTAAILVLYVVAALLAVRNVRRLRRFLAAHPGETLDR